MDAKKILRLPIDRQIAEICRMAGFSYDDMDMIRNNIIHSNEKIEKTIKQDNNSEAKNLKKNHTNKITAENFYIKMMSYIKENTDRAVDAYNGIKEENDRRRKTAWTTFLDKFCEAFWGDKDKPDREYFRIDSTGWSVLKDGNGRWNFDIAVEYENREGGWIEEFKKLCHIICDLRVIIGYEKDGFSEDDLNKKTFESLNEITPKARLKIDDADIFLIIIGIGGRNGKNRTPYLASDLLKLKPYLWNGEKFIEQLDWETINM